MFLTRLPPFSVCGEKDGQGVGGELLRNGFDNRRGMAGRSYRTLESQFKDSGLPVQLGGGLLMFVGLLGTCCVMAVLLAAPAHDRESALHTLVGISKRLERDTREENRHCSEGECSDVTACKICLMTDRAELRRVLLT